MEQSTTSSWRPHYQDLQEGQQPISASLSPDLMHCHEFRKFTTFGHASCRLEITWSLDCVICHHLVSAGLASRQLFSPDDCMVLRAEVLCYKSVVWYTTKIAVKVVLLLQSVGYIDSCAARHCHWGSAQIWQPFGAFGTPFWPARNLDTAIRGRQERRFPSNSNKSRNSLVRISSCN